MHQGLCSFHSAAKRNRATSSAQVKYQEFLGDEASHSLRESKKKCKDFYHVSSRRGSRDSIMFNRNNKPTFPTLVFNKADKEANDAVRSKKQNVAWNAVYGRKDYSIRGW